MRGRRAFVVLTIYLLLLSGFAFGIYEYLRQQSLQAGQVPAASRDRPRLRRLHQLRRTTGTALSATVGHAIFSGLLVVETLLVLVLAPAFTSGAVSLEREKQTIDLLVATPLSTFGMVLGKLLSALTWVFLLILASVPLASVVFAFGGVGPEDLLRGYALLFALAFGMGAIGLFISALVRRTQTATVLTFVAVLVLTLGSMAVHEFWRVVTTPVTASQNGFISVTAPSRPPGGAALAQPVRRRHGPDLHHGARRLRGAHVRLRGAGHRHALLRARPRIPTLPAHEAPAPMPMLGGAGMCPGGSPRVRRAITSRASQCHRRRGARRGAGSGGGSASMPTGARTQHRSARHHASGSRATRSGRTTSSAFVVVGVVLTLLSPRSWSRRPARFRLFPARLASGRRRWPPAPGAPPRRRNFDGAASAASETIPIPRPAVRPVRSHRRLRD